MSFQPLHDPLRSLSPPGQLVRSVVSEVGHPHEHSVLAIDAVLANSINARRHSYRIVPCLELSGGHMAGS
jgi:hypothetical protein